MGASRPENEIRREAARLIRSRIEKIPVAEAAADLGVSRQAIYDLKNDRYCPSLSLIQRACEAWDLKFSYRGMKVEKSVFSLPKEPPTVPTDQQLDLNLVEAIRKIDHRHFEVVEAKPVGRSVEILIRLTIPA